MQQILGMYVFNEHTLKEGRRKEDGKKENRREERTEGRKGGSPSKTSDRLRKFGFIKESCLRIYHSHALEKEMETHSCVLAWRIPGTEEPGGLPSMGSHRVGHD